MKIPNVREWPLIAGNLVRLGLLGQLREEPILIGGCGRSGTTLLLAILASHPRIFAVPFETSCFCRGAYSPDFDPAGAFRIGEFHRLLLRSEIPATAARWCEKTPKNVQMFPEILSHFEGRVRLVHMVRDCRDVVTSRHPDDKRQYHVSINRWLTDVQAGLRVADRPQVLTLKYEELVTRFEDTVGVLGDFLGEDMTGIAQHWHENTPISESNAWWTGVRRVDADSVGRWSRPEHRERVAEAMGNPQVVSLLGELAYL